MHDPFDPGVGPVADPGEREATARRVLAMRQRIRSAIRHLTRASRDRAGDTDDIISTVLFRVDRRLARKGALRSEGFEAYVLEVAVHAAVDRLRLSERLDRLIREDSPYLAFMRDRAAACESPDDLRRFLFEALRAVESNVDRQMVILRLRGAKHEAIAELLGTSVGAVRVRWHRAMRQIRAKLGDSCNGEA